MRGNAPGAVRLTAPILAASWPIFINLRANRGPLPARHHGPGGRRPGLGAVTPKPGTRPDGGARRQGAAAASSLSRSYGVGCRRGRMGSAPLRRQMLKMSTPAESDMGWKGKREGEGRKGEREAGGREGGRGGGRE